MSSANSCTNPNKPGKNCNTEKYTTHTLCTKAFKPRYNLRRVKRKDCSCPACSKAESVGSNLLPDNFAIKDIPKSCSDKVQSFKGYINYIPGWTMDWTNFPQTSDQYASGVEDYLNHSFSTRAEGGQISCPCKVCYHRYWHFRDEVYNHLIANGIGPEIKEWHFKEKNTSFTSNTERHTEHDNMENLIYDTHRDRVGHFPDYDHGGLHEEIDEDANMEDKKFFKLVEDGKQELYPGCKSFSKLSFIIRLYLFKCTHGLSNVAFSDLHEIIKKLIPEAELPKSFNEAKKSVKDLGLHYEKIDACRNDCMLFWKDYEDAKSCHVCHASRWKEVEKQQEHNNHTSENVHKIPNKVL